MHTGNIQNICHSTFCLVFVYSINNFFLQTHVLYSLNGCNKGAGAMLNPSEGPCVARVCCGGSWQTVLEVLILLSLSSVILPLTELPIISKRITLRESHVKIVLKINRLVT